MRRITRIATASWSLALLTSCALSPHGGMVFLPVEILTPDKSPPSYEHKEGPVTVTGGHGTSPDEAIIIVHQAGPAFTIFIEDYWLYEHLQFTENTKPSFKEFRNKIERLEQIYEQKTMHVLSFQYAGVSTNTYYFDISQVWSK